MSHQNKVLLSVLSIFLFLPFVTGAQRSGDFLDNVLNDERFTWASMSDGDLTIYYKEGSFAQKHRMMLLSSLKTSIPEVLDILEETGFDDPLNVFYLDSRDDMNALIGKPYSGFSHWTANSIFLVLNPEWRSFERHEFAHIVTMGTWGYPDSTSRWMIEGIPVFCDGWCQDMSIDQIAYSLLKKGQLPDLKILFTDYAGLGEIRAGFSSASFIAFVINEYGTEKIRELWHNGTTGTIEDILGEDIPTLNGHWKDYIRDHGQDGIELDLESIRQHGCG